MATVTWVVFKHHKKADGTYNPKIRISHNGTSSYIATSVFTELVKFQKGAASGTAISEKIKEGLDRMVKLTGQGADAQYLTQNQVPDTIKFEAETLTNMAYDMSNTPRISFETLKGVGKASGTAFRFMFMGAHMSVSNHAEVIGEFLQRRVNFIVSALGSINPSEFNKASQTIDIDTDLNPFMIDDLSDKVGTAVSAVGGGVWSRREGIMFAGNVDRLEDELKEIEEEQAARNTKIGEKNRKQYLSQKIAGIIIYQQEKQNIIKRKKDSKKKGKGCQVSFGVAVIQYELPLFILVIVLNNRI